MTVAAAKTTAAPAKRLIAAADAASRAAVRRRRAYVVSGALLAALPAYAEAPALPAEFWSYMLEFADDSGAVFDPADYAVAAAIPARAREQAGPDDSRDEPGDGSAATNTEEQQR